MDETGAREMNTRDATDAERAMLKDLSGCTFQVASFDKRFVRNVSAQVNATGQVTERQGALIPTMHYRYRRQHGKQTPNYNPAIDPKVHRSGRNKLDDLQKLKEWNEAQK
jgi:hypothetical protein